jgi:putative phage-type endonuclease
MGGMSAALLAGPERAAWLAQRRTGIGGSDAAAVLGLSPWVSAFRVWMEKTDSFDAPPPTPAMEWGLRLEPVIREAFEDATGLRVNPGPLQVLRHREHPWMVASLDGIVAQGGVYEGKTASPWDDGWDGIEANIVPDHVVIQAQHYMAVADEPVCHGAVLIGGKDFHTFRIDRDEQFIADLIVAEGRWWETHVLGNTPPPIDGSDSTTEAIKNLFPDSTAGTEIDLPPTARDLIIEWTAAKARKKTAETDEDEAANKLRVLLGDSETGRVDGLRAVTWKSHPQRRVNLDLLRGDYPDVAEACTETTTVRTLRPVKGFIR